MRIVLLAVLGGCIENQITVYERLDNLYPKVELSPPALDFGSPSSGELVQRTLYIHSVGELDLRVGEVDLPPNFWFEGVDPQGFLPVGDRIALEINYRADGNPIDETAWVFSDDPDEKTIPVRLIAGQSAGILLVDPPLIDFGSVVIGEVAQRESTLTNIGSAALEITELRVDGRNFTLDQSPTLPLELAPGATTTVSLTFEPDDYRQLEQGLLWVDGTANYSDSPVDVRGLGVVEEP